MSRQIKVETHSSLGVLWFIGWLFTIGYLKLGFWQGLLALIVWPYFLGAELAETRLPLPKQVSAPVSLESVAAADAYSPAIWSRAS